ncbi:cytochrome-c oxidase, cbb3-type subunit III [Pleionea sp. CnH1-48]|uniref:cytochrome-c oxidase, cbb3-type subunit III n=1 Tax=Pleionea sp. CnH1-48 TaxID=2954494 RepID=UPI00209847A0|nr:cytochrome-c oxidase, cbb3-type subunit III [Pleionea sp. CnH1-48]MCO7223937.1 cytochrome-c oxidase, cbb3-type subunit III [Pleionea sp. CnH1-48]
MSEFWSWWIIAITLICIFGNFWLLHFTKKTEADECEDGTTGHAYDGIQEYNNPLPKWWLNLFYITLAFGIGYLILFPGLGKFEGTLGWTKENQWEAEVQQAESVYLPLFKQYENTPVTELVNDELAMDMGRRIFLNVCFACHGSDAAGSPGYPNLTDNDWLYGSTPDIIEESITNGRSGQMPPFGQQFNEEQITFLTSYVVSLSGRNAPENEIAKGKALYDTNCVACHGADGKGSHAFGAPNLTDTTWLFGGSRKVIARTIRSGRNGQMPAHKDILGKAKIRLVTAYVYSLSQEKAE